jgi:hypothetical protein
MPKQMSRQSTGRWGRVGNTLQTDRHPVTA